MHNKTNFKLLNNEKSQQQKKHPDAKQFTFLNCKQLVQFFLFDYLQFRVSQVFLGEQYG